MCKQWKNELEAEYLLCSRIFFLQSFTFCEYHQQTCAAVYFQQYCIGLQYSTFIEFLHLTLNAVSVPVLHCVAIVHWYSIGGLPLSGCSTRYFCTSGTSILRLQFILQPFCAKFLNMCSV